MPRSAPYDDILMEMLKDEEQALAYLNAALDEQDPCPASTTFPCQRQLFFPTGLIF